MTTNYAQTIQKVLETHQFGRKAAHGVETCTGCPWTGWHHVEHLTAAISDAVVEATMLVGGIGMDGELGLELPSQHWLAGAIIKMRPGAGSRVFLSIDELRLGMSNTVESERHMSVELGRWTVHAATEHTGQRMTAAFEDPKIRNAQLRALMTWPSIDI